MTWGSAVPSKRQWAWIQWMCLERYGIPPKITHGYSNVENDENPTDVGVPFLQTKLKTGSRWVKPTGKWEVLLTNNGAVQLWRFLSDLLDPEILVAGGQWCFHPSVEYQQFQRGWCMMCQQISMSQKARYCVTGLTGFSWLFQHVFLTKIAMFGSSQFNQGPTWADLRWGGLAPTGYIFTNWIVMLDVCSIDL